MYLFAKEAVKLFILPAVLSAILVPLIKQAGFYLKVYAIFIQEMDLKPFIAINQIILQ